MNAMETTEGYPSEMGHITKDHKKKVYYHSPNQYYGGRKAKSNVRSQTKAVGLTMGNQHHQMNRPVGYAYSGGHIRIKNRLFDKGPGLQQRKTKVPLKNNDEGSHPINRDSLRGVLSRTRPRSVEDYNAPKPYKRKNLTKNKKTPTNKKSKKKSKK